MSRERKIGDLGEIGTQGWGDGDKNQVMETGSMGDGDQGRLETDEKDGDRNGVLEMRTRGDRELGR